MIIFYIPIALLVSCVTNLYFMDPALVRANMHLAGEIPAPTLCSSINDCKFGSKMLSEEGVHKLEVK